MSNVTGLKICHHICSEDYNYKIEEFLPFGYVSSGLDTINVMWRPGHYDILYSKDDIAGDVYDYTGGTIAGMAFA